MKVQHPLLWPCIFAFVLANAASAAHSPRQVPVPGQQNPSGTSNPANTNAPATPQPPTQATTPPTTPPTTTPPTTTPPTTAAPDTSTTGASTPPTTTPTDTATNPATTPTATPTPTPTEIVTSGSDGSFITVTSTPPLASSPAPSASAAPSDSDDDGGGGLSTGSIIGMSVAAGVAVIGIVGFFVWKFTRKRFSDFDDNEAIKWPELNAHSGSSPDSHALPARETGRSGFDTGSEADLSRVNSTSNYSTPDFGAGGPDPYAVPPLPHLNPNQPYRDDPGAGAGFYDPYRGPVPGTIEHGTGDWQTGEAYPMTQFGHPQARASPAPDYMGYDAGRQSPALYGRSSPAPQAAYGGRASPAPHAAYSGRASPGPGTAYDAFGAR